MLIEFAGAAALFALTALGLAWPLASRLALAPAEKLAATVMLSTLGTFLIGWGIYVFRLPAAVAWLAPTLAAAGLVWNRRSWIEAVRDADARSLLVGQALVSAACVGWLALIVSYSGGDWVGDWLGHWYRVRFFVERWPTGTLFFGADPLTSRPPLANVVTALFAQLTRVDFAHYQLFTTLHNSLVFLPAALLARRWGGPGAAGVLPLLLLLNPLFIQNATYAWTKLSTAAYVLTALYFFPGAHRPPQARTALLLCATCLGTAVLCHYSAGPYVVVLVIAWCASGWRRRHDRSWWSTTALGAAAGAAVLAMWFGWALAVHGVRGTFLSNPTVTDQAATAFEQVTRIALNLRDTLVPHFLREVDFTPLAQRSAWGAWRDWAFQVYQRNLILAAGSAGGVFILWRLLRQAPAADPVARRFWLGLAIGVVVLGVAAHGGRDVWGNAHICDQPLVVLGLAWLAAHFPAREAVWSRVLAAGLLIDFTFGILLQIGAESFLLDQWLTPHRSPADYLASYSEPAQFNLEGKLQLKLRFFGDALAISPALLLVVAGLLVLLAGVRARRAWRSSAP